MLLDIMIERGFIVSLDIQRIEVPIKIHPETFEIISKMKKIFHFHITFARPNIRSN